MPALVSSAAITKYHRLGDLNNRNLFSPSSGDWEVHEEDADQFTSWQELFPGLQMATSSCPHLAFLSEYVEKKGKIFLSSSSS